MIYQIQRLNFLLSGSWNQLFIVYRRRIKILTLYLVRANNTTVTRAFRVKEDLFPLNGSFAIGQWMPSHDNNTAAPNSTFNAEIEEIRIWSRRSNPSLIRRYPAINPDPSYSEDLIHLFKFDNLTRKFVKDELTDVLFTYQKWYPGLPKFSDLVIDYQKERSGFKNRSLEEAAISKCRTLFFSGDIYKRCKLLGFGIISQFYKICVSDIARSSDLAVAVHSVASFTSHCKTVLGINDDLVKPLCHSKVTDFYPRWIGVNCSQSCNFGYEVPTKFSECTCEHGYWGINCSNLCPGGVLNTCNKRGVCSSVNGTCTCNGNWKSSYMNDTETLPCSECLEGWIGLNCDVAVKEASVKVKQNANGRRISIAYGNTQYTNLAGTNFNLDLQGMFKFIGNAFAEIYIVNVACGVSPTCRRIVEIFIIGKFGEVSVSRYDGINLRVLARQRDLDNAHGVKAGKVKEIKPTFNMQSLLRDTTVTLAGGHIGKLEVLEILAGENYFLRVLLYNGGMSVIVEERHRTALSSGIATKAGMNQTSSMKKMPGKYLNGSFISPTSNHSVLSQELMAQEFSRLFSWKNSSELLLTNLSKFTQQGPGFMLYFVHSRVVAEQLYLQELLSEWSLELWIYPGKLDQNSSTCRHSKLPSSLLAKQTILSVEHQGTQYLSLQYSGQLHLEWDKHTVTTDFKILSDSWTHVAISWRAYDGRVQIHASSQCQQRQVSSHYNIKVGKRYAWNGTLVLGQYVKDNHEILQNDFIGAVDELRIWSYARSGADIFNSAANRLYLPWDGLLLTGYFDEIDKLTMPVLITKMTEESSNTQTNYSSINTINTARKINMQLMPQKNPPQWLPSTVPFKLHANYSLSYRTQSLSATANDTCFRQFYTGLLNQYCSVNLPRTASFYFESCLADIAATENANISRHSVVSFAILCGEQISVPVCRLRGIYSGFPVCPDKEKERTWTDTQLLLLVLGIIIALVIIIGVTIYLRKKNGASQARVNPGKYYIEPSPDGSNITPSDSDEGLFKLVDPFRASSLQNLRSGQNTPVGDSSPELLIKTSTFQESRDFIDEEIRVQRTLRKEPQLASRTSLLGTYEEVETEF